MLTPLLDGSVFLKKTCSWLADGLTGYDTQVTRNIEQLNSSP